MESERERESELSARKSSQIAIYTKGMIIGVVAAVIASVLAFLNKRRSRIRRPRLIRQPYINRDGLRSEIANSVLYCGDAHCSGQIRMRPQAFFNLCNILIERGLLKENTRIGVKEQGMKEEKKVNFRWTKEMSRELLGFLVEEVRKGNKPNNTFRTSSFVAAAKVVSDKFQVHCTADNVEHHMKTIRNSWDIISTVRNNFGFGWNDNLKMITASPKAHAAYVKQNPKHEKYLNRKIDLYDEIAIVARKDLARGNFSKTSGDINLNASIESGQPSITVESLPSKADSGTSSDSRPHRKRCRTEEEGFDMDQTISTQLQEVVSALKQFSNNQLDVNKLYEEIMKMEDVEEGIRMAAFDHLVEREMLAKAFLTKSLPLCKLWLEKFMKSLP